MVLGASPRRRVLARVEGEIPEHRRLVLMIACRPKAKLLTKGDNNLSDDTELYARGQDYLVRKDIIG